MKSRHFVGQLARRPVAAGLVLIATVVACVWVATYTELAGPNPTKPSPIGVALNHTHTPGWAVPVAIAVGVGGVIVALLLYRVRRSRR